MTNKIKSTISRKNARLATEDQLAQHVPETLITYRVFVAAQAMSRLVDASVRSSMDLTSRQWRILVVLNRLGTAPSGDVARLASFDHSQVSRIAVELTKLGLIQQNSDGKDRRKQLLSLTKKGIEYLRVGLPASLERERRLRARLSTSEYEVFCRALSVLTDEAGVLLDEGEGSDPVRGLTP
ncbi:MarR family winged helix-turn-helix transcriptional regulator [Parapusillimonas sp. JC17]|uniref:MarR family winged helix-turn-helix transcriptional regulator n=1 Tax=Parapusillimonas sp. JC17 TaxID=3445768 RepID=UPI003FA171EB